MSKDCCEVSKIDFSKAENSKLRRIFWIVLVINLAMFLVEIVYGFISHSSALIADSLDMASDTFVYGLSLFVISKDHIAKANASLIKGWLMVLLGLFVLGEIGYKIFNPIVPIAETISIIGIIALIANTVSLMLLMKYRNSDLNVKSSWICSRNDVMANIGVIIAGLLVGYFNSMWPDIVVGLAIATLVLYSSILIIKESRGHK